MCGELVRLQGWPLFAPDRRFGLGWSQLRRHPLHPEDDEFYSVVAEGVEVARAHLDLRQMSLASWPGASELGPTVRLQLIEVAAGLRGRGLGRAVVARLRERHAAARLIAVSVRESSGFWEALGWNRFEHQTNRGRLALYVAPRPGKQSVSCAEHEH